MSMNFAIIAQRKIIIPSANNKEEIQYSLCQCIYQAPTKVTNKLLESQDPLLAYKEWVKEWAFDGEENEDCNPKQDYIEHINRIDNWIENAKNNGYEISFKAM